MNPEGPNNHESAKIQETPLVSASEAAIGNLEALQMDIAEIKEALVGRQETFDELVGRVGNESVAVLDTLDTQIVDILEALDRGDAVLAEAYEGLERETDRVISIIEYNFNTEMYEAMEHMAQGVNEALNRADYNFDHLDDYSGSRQDAEEALNNARWSARNVNDLLNSFYDSNAKYAHFNTFVNEYIEFWEIVDGLDDAMGLSNTDLDSNIELEQPGSTEARQQYEELRDQVVESLEGIEARPIMHLEPLSLEAHNALIDALNEIEDEEIPSRYFEEEGNSERIGLYNRAIAEIITDTILDAGGSLPKTPREIADYFTRHGVEMGSRIDDDGTIYIIDINDEDSLLARFRPGELPEFN